MASNDGEGRTTTIVLLMVCVLLCGVIGAMWYQAGVQSEVYDRAGIKVSQWECFIGAKPAERAIRWQE